MALGPYTTCECGNFKRRGVECSHCGTLDDADYLAIERALGDASMDQAEAALEQALQRAIQEFEIEVAPILLEEAA